MESTTPLPNLFSLYPTDHSPHREFSDTGAGAPSTKGINRTFVPNRKLLAPRSFKCVSSDCSDLQLSTHQLRESVKASPRPTRDQDATAFRKPSLAEAFLLADKKLSRCNIEFSCAAAQPQPFPHPANVVYSNQSVALGDNCNDLLCSIFQSPTNVDRNELCAPSWTLFFNQRFYSQKGSSHLICRTIYRNPFSAMRFRRISFFIKPWRQVQVTLDYHPGTCDCTSTCLPAKPYERVQNHTFHKLPTDLRRLHLVNYVSHVHSKSPLPCLR